MASKNNTSRYSPTTEDLVAFRFCVGHNLIKMSPIAIAESSLYYLIRNNYPKLDSYFLIDNKKAPTPENRMRFSYSDALKKMFEVYKNFYMRNKTKKDQEFVDAILEKEKAEADLKKEKEAVVDKKEKKKGNLVKKANTELDLFDLIANAEKEDNNNI